MLLTAPVHAQSLGGGDLKGADAGEVKDVTITPPGAASVTYPVGTSGTFQASSTAGTTYPAPRWSVSGTAKYHWSIPSPCTLSPADAAQTTVTVPQSSNASAGTYTVDLSCQVTYDCLDDDDLPGKISQRVSIPVTIYVIGGPISGDKDEYFFCDGGDLNSVATLSAAPGQPAGTTYSWSISGSAIYCDGYGTPTTPTGASAKYRGKLPGSADVGDVTANATYSLNGVSVKSSPDWKITVHVPATFTIKSYTPAVKYAYGFSGQTITFEVRDSVKQLYPPGKAHWSESWTQDPIIGGGQPGDYGGGPLDDNSQSVDRFSSPTGLNAPSNPDDLYGDRVFGPLTHKYSITNIGGTGGDIGCPIQVYTNVYYYTYQMTGNGFAPKPSTP